MARRCSGAFLDCVEAWSKSVEDQLRPLCQPTPEWNQATAALELLCIGAAIGGRIKPDATVADMIDAAFSPPGPMNAPALPTEMRVALRQAPPKPRQDRRPSRSSKCQA